MILPPLQSLISAISRIGADPADSDEVRLRKSLVVISAVLIGLAGAVWGVLYLALGEPLAGSIPLAYSGLTLISTFIFAATRRSEPYCFRQLLLTLLLPFLLMLALGGFINSSAVILWSLLCPLGALLLARPRAAAGWFAAYLGLIVISLVAQPYLRPANNLPREVVFAFFGMNLVGPSSVVFTLLNYFVGQKDRFMWLLRREQEKSENLLLNILPKDVAVILKNENRTIADHFDAASILFTDLVGFTPMSAKLPPADMVELLNRVFTHFDGLVDKYGVEKIRTIGDSYMVASGVPRPRSDHAQALANLALDMIEFCLADPMPDGRRLAFRVGINSGPVVAGVIGRKKFIYDLWGDAVNTASRMESHSQAGCIQITQATYELVKGEFDCQRRGVVQVKGKGEMETWFLIGRRPQPSPANRPLA